ncbi:hypothetical protein GL272_22265 [Aeromonas veronii]|uniref:hypothetical protein n=1 Tax=Aeromonas veronii TaxID=654 RepID=UPI001C5BD951|nr:hypothetical protein [Aeromonas veronii]MBW3779599.1 hypothetical protein [Aeromonas veronii]
MKELEELCQTLKEGRLKSKQAAFNLHYDALSKAIGIYGWGHIASFINSYTEENLSMKTYKNMLARAKKKASLNYEKPSSEPVKARLSVKDNQATAINKQASSPDEVDYNGYMNACFNNKIIAQEAIDNDISIETIKSWGCANFVQVSTALGNYIRSKRK